MKKIITATLLVTALLTSIQAEFHFGDVFIDMKKEKFEFGDVFIDMKKAEFHFGDVFKDIKVSA